MAFTFDYGQEVGLINNKSALSLASDWHANGTLSFHFFHLSTRSIAFIIADDQKRIVFVTLDAALPSSYIKEAVVQELELLYGKTLYTRKNVCISCTHTHS